MIVTKARMKTNLTPGCAFHPSLTNATFLRKHGHDVHAKPAPTNENYGRIVETSPRQLALGTQYEVFDGRHYSATE